MTKQSEKDRIRKMINAVKKASKGDFSARLDRSEKKDELDELAAAIQKLLHDTHDRLSKTVPVEKKGRNKPEEIIEETKEKLRTILDNIGTSYFELDLNGTFTYFNDNVQKDFGYSREELMGMNYKVYTKPENIDLIYSLYHEIYLTGMPKTVVNYGVLRKDGSPMMLEMSVSLMKGPSGKPVGFRGVGRDITDRVLMEQALRQSEEMYRSILETMNEGLFENDLEGNFTYVNSAGCKMVGYECEELVGRNFREVSSPELANYLQEAFRQVYETGTSELLVEYEVKHKDGSVRILQYHPWLIRDSKGKPIGFRNLVRDITERKNAEDALRKSEERYRTILETMNECLFENDLAGNLTFVNEAACKMMGYERDEMIGRNFREFISPEPANLLYEAFHRVYKTGNPEMMENYEIIRKDGSKRILQSYPSLTRDSSGKPIGFHNLVRDVTDQKNAEDALRKSEEKYRTILETMNEGLFENDLKGNYTYLNDAACRMVGYEREELIGRSFRETSSPELAKFLHEVFRRVYETGNPEMLVDYEVRHKDGSVRIHQSHPSLIRDSNGKPIGFRNLVRDVTELKNAEIAMRKSEERYRMIAENVHDIIWTIDVPGMRYTYVSPAVFGVMGFRSEELLSKHARDYMTPASYAFVERLLAEEHDRKDSAVNPLRTMELELNRKDGGTVWVEVAVTYNRDAKGAIAEILGVTRDITERKRAEEERHKLETQLLHAQKMESVGRLAGGVAHDFNNMLNVILGYAELIKIQLSNSDPLFKDVTEIEKAAYRSRDVTRQLLAFSRKQIIAPRPVDLNELILNMQNSLVRLIGEDIDLRFCPGEKLWRIQFDPSQMEQIIFNLGVNARDAMPVGGKLTIETENVQLNEAYCRDHLGFTPGQYVLLGVSDDGAGMDKETLSHVFEPFFTTKETGKGTGLGLATVYGIVKQNDGLINVYSEPGRGTVFRIYIPRSMKEGDVAEEEEDATIVLGTGNVLLVEDDEMVRKMTSEMLGALGYSVTATGDPYEALSMIQEPDTKVDLIITDVVMPGMSGTDLRDKIIDVRPGIKVLFMSGYTSNVIVHRGVLEENVHFIQKPFNLKDFARKVSETIKGT
jgi:two-component system cell cycle sensor histidine kinase/response regulator CckA